MANLREANFSGADLSGADLGNANLFGATLHETRIDTSSCAVLVGDGLTSFVPYALSEGAIALDPDGNPLPDTQQDPDYYR